MRNGLFLGIFFAFGLHGVALLFGGALFKARAIDYASTQKVDLLSADEPDKKKKPEEEPERQEVKTDAEQAPDAAKVIEKIEMAQADNTPKLEAASLGAIEAALTGQGGAGGDFASGMSFASGGRIGGTGKAGAAQGADDAFSMSEIDQKPRVIFQSTPVYPADMHSVKGLVTLIFIVDASGRVTSAKVESSSNPGFEKAALEAIRQWKFEPAVKGGQRVPCKMRSPIRFQPR